MILTKVNIESIDLETKIFQYVKAGRFSEFILVVPTNRKLRSLKKSFIDNSPRRVATGINIDTMTTISTNLLKLAESFTELSEAAASVFIKMSAEKTTFKYFNNYKDSLPEGTLERIRNVISKYKESGISPEMIIEEASKLTGSENNKALDIAEIYKHYSSMCDQAVAYEIGDVYNRLNALKQNDIIESFRSAYPSVKEIFINGFDEFTKPEIDIIDKLSCIEGVSLYIDFDYFSYNKFIFSNLDKNYERLTGKGFRKVADISEYSNSRFIEGIRTNLFKSGSAEKELNAGGQLCLFSADTREEEVEKIARQIKLLLKENSELEPHRICVCFNLIEKYSPLIRDVFERYSIPFNLTDRINLNKTYPVNSIISFLEISESNFYFKNIIRTFSSRYLDKHGIDTTNLLNQARENKVVSGYERWINSLEQSLKKLEMDDISAARKELKKRKILNALNDIKLIKKLLKPFETKTTIDEFIENLTNLINQLGIHRTLINSDPISSEKNVKAITEFISTVSETFYLLKKFENADEKHGLSYYLRYIRTACVRARFNIKERSDYGVLITTLNEIRGLKFDYLFMGGLIDGDLPTRYLPEIFLSGSYSKNEALHQTEERFHFYQALCTWERGLYLLYPSSDSRTEFTESSFIKELEKVFKIDRKGKDKFSEIIISKDEFLKNMDWRKDISDLKLRSNPDWQIDFERIRSKIEIEEKRSEDIFSESEYHSFLLSEENKDDANDNGMTESIRNKLDEYANQAFSISELETYVKCPFKYFLERVLKVEAAEEPTEEFEALEIGSALHSILFTFYRTLREKNITLSNCSDKIFGESINLIFSIAGKVVDDYNLDSGITFYELEKIFGIEGKRQQSILYKFVEYERNVTDKLIPGFFEVNFGLKNGSDGDDVLSSMPPVEVDEIKLKGKIDRIDLNKDDREYSITDYKIGRSYPTRTDIDSGISLQLPVYMMAAKSLLKYHFDENFSPKYMNIFSLRMNVKDFGINRIYSAKKEADQLEINEEIVKNTIGIIKEQVNKIMSGEFHLSKLDNREQVVCRFCNFKSVCRVEEYLV